jgi:hypothetical protein
LINTNTDRLRYLPVGKYEKFRNFAISFLGVWNIMTAVLPWRSQLLKRSYLFFQCVLCIFFQYTDNLSPSKYGISFNAIISKLKQKLLWTRGSLTCFIHMIVSCKQGYFLMDVGALYSSLHFNNLIEYTICYTSAS